MVTASPDPLPDVDRATYRAAMGRFATGIAVVTTVARGVQHAMTVNSMTSVSLNPLLMVFCAEKVARFHDAVLASGVWGVSILGAGSAETSRWFASRGRPLEHQLEGYPWRSGPATGCALLDEAISTLECRTTAVHDGGDHTLVLGEVLSVSLRPGEAEPLIYYESGYHSLPGSG